MTGPAAATPADRACSPAAERNRDAILAVLREALPGAGVALEVAAGSGQHAVHLAAGLPGWQWHPTDADPAALRSIAAWTATAALANLAPPARLDVRDRAWPLAHADAVVCINMIHIAPWESACALVEGAARILDPGGLLYLYGPFRRDGRHTAPGNAAFDANLRARDPAWGVRDLEVVAALAGQSGFGPPALVAMPANNLSVLFRRQAGPPPAGP